MAYDWRMQVVAVVVATACNKSTSRESSASSSHGDGGVRWFECTDDVRSEIEAALLTRFDLAVADNRLDGLTCVTIQFARQPALFVELVGERDGRRRRMHGVLAMDRTTTLVPVQDAKLDWAQLRGAKVWFETADLDADGTDELVVHRGDDRHPVAEWVDLVAIRSARFIELKGPRIAYEDPDIGDSCRGQLSIEPALPGAHAGTPGLQNGVGGPHHLVVTTTASNGPSEHCLARGRHEFALVGERLVELDSSRHAAQGLSR